LSRDPLHIEGFRVAPVIAEAPVTFTSVLEARRETVAFLARLLRRR
jgi:hypothetical protein